MSLKFTENEIERVQEGNFSKISDKLRSHIDGGGAVKFSEIQKFLLSNNKDTAEKFKFELKETFPNNVNVKFAINQAETSKQVDTLVEVANEALLRDNSLIARLTIRESGLQTPYIDLRELNVEQDAEVLAGNAAGTPADDTLRVGDSLMPKATSNASKVQASFQMEELSEYFLNDLTTIDYQRRLVNRVQNKIIDRVLYAGNGVANGTARAQGQIRGIVNNYGVNGTGDATNFIGAITYSTFAAVNTATGKTGVNEYEQALYVKALTLANNVSEAEESDYVFVMNRKTWGKIRTAKDLNGRFLAQNGIDPYTNKPVPMIDGNPVILHTSVADNFAFLFPARFYQLFMIGGLRSLNDGGLVQLREGITTYVARTYIDGSMNYGHKYLSNTAATIGTTPVDNANQNVFRYFTLALS